jgi:hypothetical protein
MGSPILTVWDTTTGKELFRKLVRKTFDSTDREALIESEKLYNMMTSDKLFERTMRFAGLPSGAYMVEGGKIPLYDPKFGGTVDYNQKEYGIGFRVSWMMRKTNQFDMVQRWTKSLRRKLDETKDIELAKIWNSPTATYTGYDGYALGYATHSCLDDAANTYDNIISGDLNLTSLQAAELYFDTLKDDQGATFFVNTKNMVLYYHPALKVRINEIQRSTGKWNEISNTMNFWEGRFSLHTYRRLTSSTAWGLAAKGDDRYDVNCFTLAEPHLVEKDASDNSLDNIVLGHQAFSFGFGDPRLVVIGNT